jgi:phospholipid/cholesterol/gamma-HCH transport system substrate-binding protein
MEHRAPFAIVGAFLLAAIAGVFAFVYWLNNTSTLAERTAYHVRFEQPVLGLMTGSSVLFNGIRVGEITRLRLEPDKPRQVIAVIAVDPSTPIRADTQVDIEFQGLAGVAVITLTGGTVPFGSLEALGPRVLVADASVGQSMTQAARLTLRRLDGILGENAESLRGLIGNLNTFSAALARNSSRIDGIVGGLERMTGGAAEKPLPVIYDLSAPRDFPGLGKPPQGQIVVPEVTTILALDTQRIVVRPAPPKDAGFADAQWSDSLPKLLQAKLLQSLENAGMVAVRPTDGLDAKHQLLVDLRAFSVSAAPEAVAEVEFSAKVLDKSGRIVSTQIFRATAPVALLEAATTAAALNQAFGAAAVQLVLWVAGAA